MGDNGGNSNDKATIDRRAMLKGAAAAGVGVAAWSAPSITTLGFTPAYAQTCTPPITTYEIGTRNTDCGGCGDFLRWKPLGSACGGIPFPGVNELREDSCAGAIIGNSGECTPNAGICLSPSIGGLPAGSICRLKVTLVSNGACSDNILPGYPVFGDAGPIGTQTWYALPEAPIGSGGVPCSSFVRVQIECSTDPMCFV